MSLLRSEEKRRNTSGESSMSLHILLPLIILLLTPSVFAARKERLIDTWRPSHYNINIALNKELTEISFARVEIDIVAVKQLSLIDLDFGDLTTDQVLVNNEPHKFVHRNGRLEINLTEPARVGTNLRIAVLYHGKPKDGLVLAPNKDGSPSAVGDNWPDRVHHWIPCLDHPSAKATVSFMITASPSYVAVANGRLKSVTKNGAAGNTWIYEEGVPIPPYCMIIAVGEFSQREPEQSSLTPLSYLVPFSDREYSVKGFSSAGPTIQFFNDIVGPYPYEKLALIIGVTRFGGMENSSAIVFTSNLFTPNLSAPMSKAFGIPTNIENVVAHEIAHQWFGDSVTEATWADLWLSEGFASYFAGLFIQKYEGEQAFQDYMKKAADAALAFEKKTRTPIHDTETEDLFKLLNANNYQKGSWVLHMLRSRLGDDVFFQGIKNYYLTHKESTASTEDLRLALEKSSGQKLSGFFKRWVYDSGHPQYELIWDWLPQQKSIKVTVTQVQTGEAFMDPIPLAITTSSSAVNAVITPSGKTTTQVIKLREKPAQVVADPQNTLFKEVTVKAAQ
jgi:aminopeptidase N